MRIDQSFTNKAQWKQKSFLGFLLLLVLSVLFSQRSDALMSEQARVLEIEHTIKTLAASRKFWPGYDPLTIPLAIYGGKKTYLFRHPANPEGFSTLEEAGFAIQVYTGRHPAVNANSSSDIAGTVSATLLADSQNVDLPASQMAAIALHEAFHVYQRNHHPSWMGDEAVLFSYPVDDPTLLALRRLETEALRRALTQASQSACWAALTLEYRRQRFAQMDSSFGAYERGTELNEGLAAYIQLIANGHNNLEHANWMFKATEVRQRTYVTGPALALLLDQFDPGWVRALEQHDENTLDEMLSVALSQEHDSVAEACGFSSSEIADAKRLARVNTRQILADRKQQRAALEQMKGWRVVVLAHEAKPLWPQGFDPLNVELLQDGLLHKRWLRLGNDSGQLDALDGEQANISVLTRRAGEHPLYNGIRWAMIAGLSKPDLNTEERAVKIVTPGLNVQFSNATAEVEGHKIIVTLH